MKRRSWRLLTVLLVGCVLLAGCGERNRVVSYTENQQAETIITFFGNKVEPENVRVIEEIISGFMAENPDIRVSYESLKGTAYYDALSKRLVHGKGDDVFMVNHDVLLDLVAAGQVAELSDMDILDQYTEAMLGQMREADGAVYWLPTTVSMFGLYCNLDILKAHGQEVPRDLAAWERVCAYFVEQGVTPVVANNDISLKTLAIGLSFYPIYQEDRQAEVFARLPSGQERLSDYLRPGLALVESFIARGYVDADKALSTKKTSDDLQQFAQGTSPFMLTGAWAAGRVREMNESLAFEVAPLPILADGALLVINADTRLAVNADGAHIDAAKRFVAYFTRPENIARFAAQQYSFSPLKGGNLQAVEEIQPLAACYESGTVVFGTDAGLRLPIWELTAEAGQRLLAREALDEVLSWLDEQAEEVRQP